MRIFEQPIETQNTAKKLENATGTEFERYAQFFLLLIFKDYKKTRLHKDDGIDGFRTMKSKSGKRKYEYFSIYGPESKTTWNNCILKIKNDFESIIKDSVKNDSIISKWYLVTNFGFTKQREQQVQFLKERIFMQYFNSSEPPNIEFEWYYPEKMAVELDTKEKMFQMTAFTNGLPISTFKLTDFFYHKFAENVLKLLSEHESSTTTEQFDFINKIYQCLLFYIPMEKYLSDETSIKKGYNLKKLLKNHTRIPNDDGIQVHYYDVKTREFNTYDYNQAIENHLLHEEVIKSELTRGYTLRIEDLSMIYQIIKFIRKTLSKDGTYSVAAALENLYQEENKKTIPNGPNKLPNKNEFIIADSPPLSRASCPFIAR